MNHSSKSMLILFLSSLFAAGAEALKMYSQRNKKKKVNKKVKNVAKN